MNRWILGMAAFSLFAGAQSANAQVYAYGVPSGAVYAPGSVYPAPVYAAPVYPAPVYNQPSPVVTSAYYAPAYAPVMQMGYSVPVVVPARTVIAAPVIVGPGVVRQTTRVTPLATLRRYVPMAQQLARTTAESMSIPDCSVQQFTSESGKSEISGHHEDAPTGGPVVCGRGTSVIGRGIGFQPVVPFFHL